MEDDTKTDEISGAETLAPRKIIPAEGWAEVIRLRENADPGEEEACKKWGITGKTLSMHITRKRKEPGASALYGKKGWRKVKAAEEPAPKVDGFESKREERIEKTKERVHAVTEIILHLQGKYHKEALDGTLAIGENDSNLKALNRSADIIRKIYDVRRSLLGIDKQIDEENLTVLQMEDLSQPEIERMRSVDTEDEDAFDIAIEDLEVDDGGGEVVET